MGAITIRVMIFIIVVLASAHSVLVAFGFAPTVLSSVFHSSKCSHLHMGEDIESDVTNEASGNESRKRGSRRRLEGTKMDDDPQRRKGPTVNRDTFSRAKMKKSTSSSCSKLLTPPSIISSSPRYGSEGRRWANNLGQPKGIKKRISTQNGVEKAAEDTSAKKENTPLRGAPPPPFKSPRRARKKRKHTLDAAQSRDKNIPIPPFASAPDGGVSFPPRSLPSDSLEAPPDFFPSPSNRSSLFLNQPELPHFLPSETDMVGPAHIPNSAIEGVLPVSELFYRSTQSMFSSGIYGDDTSSSSKGQANDCEQDELCDDEELPFSAEQSDRLSTRGNKIQIRRNEADDPSLILGDIVSGMQIGMEDTFPSEVVRRELTTMAKQEQEEKRRLELRMKNQPRMAMGEGQSRGSTQDGKRIGGEKVPEGTRSSLKPRANNSKSRRKDRNGRKMVRRGMEMLVGGEPINADPPQRSVEINYYRKHPKLWARAITTNSRDFGPLLHMHSAAKVEKESIGLFCENFVGVTKKWGICPDDLNSVVSRHQNSLTAADDDAKGRNDAPSVSEKNMEALVGTITSPGTRSNYTVPSLSRTEEDVAESASGQTMIFNSRELDAPKGFGSGRKSIEKRKGSRGGRSGMTSEKSLWPIHTRCDQDCTESEPLQEENTKSHYRLTYALGGELKFSLGVSGAELEYGHGRPFCNVLRDGIGLSINADEMGFDVLIAKLEIKDVEGGSTDIVVQFQLNPREAMRMDEAERAAKEVNGALASAMDEGKMAMALAHVALEEKGWSARIRNRIVEDFLFETEDDNEERDFVSDETDAEDIDSESDSRKEDTYDGPFGMEGDIIHAKDDIWLGGGNGGVFFDYSKSNYLNSEYQGKLGPYLVDAAIERARQNQPRVIVIGDVHGCIDELKALLKKCDYHPGDTIVFLGDLVCKGPDSLSVVEMAREVGAIGVRGNHDFEVVRWHQAIKSGADPPVIGSEHYYVASSLSTADLKWLYSLPWFISSSHLNALFVHAGFVSGIRLAKQNPRLMMNMRSILPDGTVTSKFFNNWPWARLWDGPQTVFFGHDADRGLQQYEHAIGLDTGCVYGGKLTACILPERRLVSVNAKREYFQYRRKHFD
eukprot:CAMPEP_0172537540 /NCGR_PEP_ID=MMETSP1067-20121228/9123_1 /TAXON_ID=265564 ORGANISM="Thalassiosira punctigera, Strain Tpunct2005C2" /NCGR_SAMPLE_ID=MMETSP1067 /ASSEMBLY_ACC=CAM_ASM_000444 /LENGTH=1114 /DNA_ID=CAMNT_0013322865 /DNA_START=212 /DNA_END=3556 /DNA_ORIENTATION=-